MYALAKALYDQNRPLCARAAAAKALGRAPLPPSIDLNVVAYGIADLSRQIAKRATKEKSTSAAGASSTCFLAFKPRDISDKRARRAGLLDRVDEPSFQKYKESIKDVYGLVLPDGGPGAERGGFAVRAGNRGAHRSNGSRITLRPNCALLPACLPLPPPKRRKRNRPRRIRVPDWSLPSSPPLIRSSTPTLPRRLPVLPHACARATGRQSGRRVAGSPHRQSPAIPTTHPWTGSAPRLCVRKRAGAARRSKEFQGTVSV